MGVIARRGDPRFSGAPLSFRHPPAKRRRHLQTGSLLNPVARIRDRVALDVVEAVLL